MAMLLAAPLLLAVTSGPAQAAVQRAVLSNAQPTNLVNITPIRVERSVSPGQMATERITVFNDSDQAVTMTATVLDLGPPEDETLLAEPLTTAAKFGARDWITPELSTTVLKPFEKVSFDLIIDPPPDAPVGSSIAGVQFTIAGSADAAGAGDVGVRVTSMLQVLLTVPGETKYALKLLDARTRSAFHMGGTSFVSYGLRYRNDGNRNEHVRGTVRIRSLFGNVVETIKLRERILIRGASGSDRAVWSDVPSFGLFSADVELVGDAGTPIRRSMGRIVLLPPWWLLALLASALIIPPSWVWWRRRREWMQFLDDVDDDDEHLAY